MSILTIIAGRAGGSTTGGGGGTLSTPSISLSQSGPGAAVVIDWADVTNATSYQVQRATNSGFSAGLTTLGTPTASTYSDTDTLSDGVTYYYRVKAMASGFTDSAYDSDSIVYDNGGAPTPPFNLTSNVRVIDKDGTVGVDCDYNSLTDAYADITDNAISKQYNLHIVARGTQLENGVMGFWGEYAGLTMKHFVHIKGLGASRDDIVITGHQQSVPANEVLADVFHLPATCMIENITIQAQNTKYCIHCDYTGYEYDLWLKNVKLIHLGSVSGYSDNIGCGMYGGDKITAVNCEGIVGSGFYAHGNASTSRDLAKHFEIELYGCNFNLFLWQDYIEYAANTITLTNNTIDTVDLRTVTSVYDANPGNPACNTGTKVYTPFFNSGNTVDALIRDSETAAILGTTMDDVTDFN